MTPTTPAAVPTKVRLRTADDLMAALQLTDIGTRMTVLRGIAAEPGRALALGTDPDGRDVVDELLRQANQKRGQTDWLALVGTLAAFSDSRVTAFFQQILTVAENPQLVFFAAERLSREPAASLHAFLTSLLLQNDSVARARAAADLLAGLLAGLPTLSLPERVRVALLASVDGTEAPPLDDASAPFYFAELAGPFGPEARDCLETLGEPAFCYLREQWDALCDADRIWLLRWAVNDWPLSAPALIARALERDGAEVALAALQSVPAVLGDDSRGPLRPLVSRWARHADPALRRAAIEAGAQGVDWRGAALETETDPAVRRACIARLAEQEGAAGVSTLIALLEDADWQTRATAAGALIEIGSGAATAVPVAEAVKPLAHDCRQAVQVAAVQVLIGLGEQAWLEKEFLASSAV